MNKIIKTSLSFLLVFFLLSPYTASFAETINATLDNEANNDNTNPITVYYSEEDYWASKENSRISLYSLSDSANISKLKEFIYSELKNQKSIIDISSFCTNLTKDNISSVSSYYFDTLFENPDIFYAPNSVGISYSYNSKGNIISCTLIINYAYNTTTLNKMINTFTSKVNEIKSQYLDGITDPLQLEYEIYDYILNNTEYDLENFNNNTVPAISHTAYGSLINGVAVCDGYAKAAKLLFDIVGIESGIIISDSMNHAWNYAKINGNYYHLDLTWEDTESETDRRNYKYFNLSDTEMSKDHECTSTYPTCTSSAFSFLRSINSNKLFRLKDKIYYINSDNAIYSMNLDGSNKTSLISNINASSIVGYTNILYLNHNSKIYQYNLYANKLEAFNTDIATVNNLDIFNGVLKATTSNGTLKFDLKLTNDFNNDGVVNILDLSTLSLNYNINSSSSSWNSKFDLNSDNIIDIFDIIIFSKSL